MHGESDGLIVP